MAGDSRLLPDVDMQVDRSFRHYFITQATGLLGCGALCGRNRGPCGPGPEPAAARKRRPTARDELGGGALSGRPADFVRPEAEAPGPRGGPATRSRLQVKPSPPLPYRHRTGGEFDDLDAMIPGEPSSLFKKGGSWAKAAPPPRPVRASAIFGDAVLDGSRADGCGL